MPRQAFMNEADDLQWLRDVHLHGVPLPAKWRDFKCAVMQGNPDAPYAVNLFAEDQPTIHSPFYRITFEHEAPIYCECVEYTGTNVPVEPTRERHQR